MNLQRKGTSQPARQLSIFNTAISLAESYKYSDALKILSTPLYNYAGFYMNISDYQSAIEFTKLSIDVVTGEDTEDNGVLLGKRYEVCGNCYLGMEDFLVLFLFLYCSL